MAKTPKGQDRTGPQREESRPEGRSRGEVPTIDKLKVETEEQSAAVRNKGVGIEDTRDLQGDPVKRPPEEPERLDSVRELGPVEEG